MKALAMFCSHDGNTRFMAQQVAEATRGRSPGTQARGGHSCQGLHEVRVGRQGCPHREAKGRVFQKMGKALAGNDVLGENDFVEPLTKDMHVKAADTRLWAQDLLCAL